MHNPVLSFFYQGLGMTPEQIGWGGVITTAGALMFGPIYGWILDRHSAFCKQQPSCTCSALLFGVCRTRIL
jgi:hypothetical protein